MKPSNNYCRYVKLAIRLFTIICAFLIFSGLFPSMNYVTEIHASTSTVSATVVDQSFNAPVLIAPAANTALNTTRPTFSWNRPSPTPSTPLNHYDLYIDNQVFAASVSDSVIYQDYYFYTASASAGVFYISLKTDLAQGTHSWKVIAVNNAGTTATSETRTFYIDSLPPFISVTKVDQKVLTWNTSIPSSIPDVQSRYLNVTTSNPLIKGGVEISSNFKITLVCPQNIPNCTNQIYTANIPSGLWEYRFSNLLSGRTYTVKASATDAGGNSTIFPDFFITYGAVVAPTVKVTSTPTPSLALTPTITPTSTISATPSPTLPFPETTLTPPPGLLAVITPVPFAYNPPESPTPPPPKKDTTTAQPIDLFYNFLLVLVILGLPLHLLMSIIGSETPLSFIHKFLFVLAFPFLRNKKYRTTPFTFMNIFISDKLDHPWQSVVSDIRGYFDLKSPIPENIFINLSAFGRTWKDNLYKGIAIPITCLFPIPVKQLDAHSRLLKTVYDIRTIPLAIACLTSITVFIIKPSYPVLIYIYFSLQYLFSEYVYPRISN